MYMIPCLTWVKRGIAKSVPEKVQVDKEELKRIIEETRDKVNEAENDDDDTVDGSDGDEDLKEDGATGDDSGVPRPDIAVKQKKLKAGSKRKREGDDIVDKYDLDDYDDEGEDDMMKGLGDLTCFATNEDDPYLTMKEDDSDDEDFAIKATDNLIITGKAEKEMCSLIVHVYNEDLGNLYVHHDILLSSFPLAVEWLNFDIGEEKPGNFVAVGTMDPFIEIWDIDVVDSLEPVAILGTKMTKKKNKKPGGKGHSDAILDLSWNSTVRNILASASADTTVGLWDLTEGTMVTSIRQHNDKVQCLEWQPGDQQTLLTGSFDKSVRLFDCRNPKANVKKWNLSGEVEKVAWNTFNSFNYFASTDDGMVYCIDSRKDKPLFTLSAHEEAVTGICQSSGIPDLLVTTSSDQIMKIWDVQNNKPSLVLSRNLKLNQLFSAGACPEAPFVFAVGGEKEIKVWDIRESAAVRKHFASRSPSGVTMEGDGDVPEDLNAEAMDGLTLDPGEEDIDTIFGEDDSNTAPKKKKKKKKKKKSTMVLEGEETSSMNAVGSLAHNTNNQEPISMLSEGVSTGAKKKKKKRKKSKQEVVQETMNDTLE
ncbi:hypothetical protein FSP39_004904 [Pinctada imbricata]|uniref:Anaphase-promoting complex subunit 4-like WD40 domain-containing protein n=1 Tax=Pinctada imbricata TaxID=66713 RepID=A0AA88XPW7_PINIB|nr:hypothetical protein FSP39_004904 [Pinctada imbricata]